MSKYSDSWVHTRMLSIAQDSLDRVERSRVREDTVIGMDNWDRLYVSTVFSAIAIEAAINDFLQIHCLFAHSPYLQEFFGKAVDALTRLSTPEKIKLVKKFSSCTIEQDLLDEVRRLIEIRNRIIHQKGEFTPGHKREEGTASLSLALSPVKDGEIVHMMRHPDIARRFLSSFGSPGTAELDRWKSPSEQDSRQISFRFVGGPIDGELQNCNASQPESWWRVTGEGEVGARIDFTPDNDWTTDGGERVSRYSTTVRYVVTERTERVDIVDVVCTFVGIVDDRSEIQGVFE